MSYNKTSPLDLGMLASYRLISNYPFLSILEKAVTNQLWLFYN